MMTHCEGVINNERNNTNGESNSDVGIIVYTRIQLIVEKLPRKRKLEETGTEINLHVGEVHAVQVTEHLVDL